jgi:hypothetical protein
MSLVASASELYPNKVPIPSIILLQLGYKCTKQPIAIRHSIRMSFRCSHYRFSMEKEKEEERLRPRSD